MLNKAGFKGSLRTDFELFGRVVKKSFKGCLTNCYKNNHQPRSSVHMQKPGRVRTWVHLFAANKAYCLLLSAAFLAHPLIMASAADAAPSSVSSSSLSRTLERKPTLLTKEKLHAVRILARDVVCRLNCDLFLHV